MLHSFKANIRVFTFYIVLFWGIVIIAHDVPFNQDVLPLCPPQLDRSSYKKPKEILEDMDPSSGVTCDLATANCHYIDKYNARVSYNCLDQLGSTTEERAGASKEYMELESIWDWLLDVIPMVTGPLDPSTGLPRARAAQMAKFDTMWRGDGLPVLEGDPDSFPRFRPYLAHFPPFFLAFCAFSPSRRGGSNEPQAGAQGQETVARAPKHRFAGLANSGCWERMA